MSRGGFEPKKALSALGFLSKFTTQPNRELFSRNREFSRPIREFSSENRETALRLNRRDKPGDAASGITQAEPPDGGYVPAGRLSPNFSASARSAPTCGRL